MHQLFLRFKHFFVLKHQSARDKHIKLTNRIKAVLLRDYAEGYIWNIEKEVNKL